MLVEVLKNEIFLIIVSSILLVVLMLKALNYYCDRKMNLLKEEFNDCNDILEEVIRLIKNNNDNRDYLRHKLDKLINIRDVTKTDNKVFLTDLGNIIGAINFSIGYMASDRIVDPSWFIDTFNKQKVLSYVLQDEQLIYDHGTDTLKKIREFYVTYRDQLTTPGGQ